MFWRPTTSNRKSTADPLIRGFEPQSSAVLLSTFAILVTCFNYCLSAQQEQPLPIRENPEAMQIPLPPEEYALFRPEQDPLPVREEAEVAQVTLPVKKLDFSRDRKLVDLVELKVIRSASQAQRSRSSNQRTMSRDTRLRSADFGSGCTGSGSASRDKKSASTKQRPVLIAVRRHALKSTKSSFRIRRSSQEAQGPSFGPRTIFRGSISSFLVGSTSSFKGPKSRFKGPKSLFKASRLRKPTSLKRATEMFNTSLDYRPLREVVSHPQSQATPRLKHSLPHRRIMSRSLDRVIISERNQRTETSRLIQPRHRLRHENHRLNIASQSAQRPGGSDIGDPAISRIKHFRCETGCTTGQRLRIGRHSNRQEARLRRIQEGVVGREPNAISGSASSTVSLNSSASSAVQCLLLNNEMTLLVCSGEELFLPNGSLSSTLSSASSSSFCISQPSTPFFFSSTFSASSFSTSSSSYFSQSHSSSSTSSFSSSSSTSSSFSLSFKRRTQILAVLRPRFCDHLRGLDALDLDLVDSNCVHSLTSLMAADDQAAEMYGQFERLLTQFDCDDQYSVLWSCDACKV